MIDADGHVEESVAMFSSLDPDHYPRRPLPLMFDTDTAYDANNAVWLIDGRVCLNVLSRGGERLGTPTTMERARLKSASIPAQEMTDVPARLRDLDAAGIDVQVVYPTLFLVTTADDVELEAALLRSYNSFMAEACGESGGRIKFAALVPIRYVEESVREVRRAKTLGAVAVMLLGIAWDKGLGHKKLYPLYEEVASLDLPICTHFGWGCPAITEAFEGNTSFDAATLPVLSGFRAVMASGVLEDFPRLRFGFLETGSQWVPWVIHQLQRRRSARRDPAEYFREGRVYVACEADEDINYLVSCLGEDGLVVASDYPHGDFSREDNIRQAIMAREDVPLRVREKILSANPQGLYGL